VLIQLLSLYLTNRGFQPGPRFSLVDGKGDSSPIADNSTTGKV
jgi:outer membrane protein OmpA-like peptidoglycan-associated protein